MARRDGPAKRDQSEAVAVVRWLRGYGAATIAVAAGAVYGVVGLVGGDRSLLWGGPLVMGVFAAILVAGKLAGGRLRLLRGETDERERWIGYRAIAFSYNATVLVCFVWFVVDVAVDGDQGADAFPPVFGVMALSYLLALAYHALRDRLT